MKNVRRIVIGTGFIDKVNSAYGECPGWDLFKHGDIRHSHADVKAKRNFKQIRGKLITLVAEIK